MRDCLGTPGVAGIRATPPPTHLHPPVVICHHGKVIDIEKSPVPGRNQTHDILIVRLVLFCCDATSNQKLQKSAGVTLF